MKYLRFLIWLPVAVLVSCDNGNSVRKQKADINSIARQMAQVECKAIELREKRFALADDIRYTQEAMMQLAGKGDTTQLSKKLVVLNRRKEHLLKASLQLADQIRYRLDSLMTNELTTTEAKATFNKELNNALEKDCACAAQHTVGVGKPGSGT